MASNVLIALFTMLGLSLSPFIHATAESAPSVLAGEIQPAGAPIVFDVGIHTSVSFSFVSAYPTILHVELAGDTAKRVSGGFIGWPEIDLLRVDTVPPHAVPAWPVAFGSDEGAGSGGAVYLLDGGRYQMDIHGRISGWSSSINFDNDILTLTITTDVSSFVQPPWLPLVNQWLVDVGLGDEFRVLASSHAPDYSFGGRVGSGRLARALFRAKAGEGLSELRELSEDRDQPLIREAAGEDADGIFVFVSTQLDRDVLLAFEYEFLHQHGQDFWTRLFRKIALHAGVPLRAVVGFVPVFCDASYLFEARPGLVTRSGSVCKMAVHQREAPTWIHERLAAAAIINGPSSSDRETFGEMVEEFLEAQIDAIGGSLEFTQRDSTYVEALVRGVRGWVIHGGREWEKVQLSFLLAGEENARVLLFVDGMTASGIGDTAPADSRFRYAMEPDHSSSLTAFARSLLDEFLNQAEVE